MRKPRFRTSWNATRRLSMGHERSDCTSRCKGTPPICAPDNGSPFDPNYKGRGLQIHVTVEDKGAFTMPWSAIVTLRRAVDEWLELVCAENTKWYPETDSAVAVADKPDF